MKIKKRESIKNRKVEKEEKNRRKTKIIKQK